MPRQLPTLALVSLAVLYFSASIALSVPVAEDYNYPVEYDSEDDRNSSTFTPCPAGHRNYSSGCNSSEVFVGSSILQFLVYDVIPLPGNDTDTDSKLRPRRRVACCEGIGFLAISDGESDFRFIGCGFDAFSGAVYWGNNTGYPGIRCRGIHHNDTVVSWRYRNFTLPGGSD